MQRAPAIGKISRSRAGRHGIVATRARGVSAFTLEEAEVKTLNVSAAIVGVGLFLFSSSAFAQQMAVDPPTVAKSSTASNGWFSSDSTKDYQQETNKHLLGIGLSTGAFIVPWRWEVAN